jgi:ABC-type siderophore export system fused ATPase/permease subunit
VVELVVVLAVALVAAAAVYAFISHSRRLNTYLNTDYKTLEQKMKMLELGCSGKK